MNRIKKGKYDFLCEIGCPYNGEIENFGIARSHSRMDINPRPSTGEVVQSRFITFEQMSTYVEEPSRPDNREIIEYIREQIVKPTLNGFEVWDVKQKIYRKFGKEGKVDITITGNHLTINASDSFQEYWYSTENVELYLDDINSSLFNGAKFMADGSGVALSAHKKSYWDSLKDNKSKGGKPSKSKIGYHILKQAKKYQLHKLYEKKYLEPLRATRIYKHFIPQAYKWGSYGLGFISAGFVVYDTFETQTLKTSHLFDTSVIFVCTFASYGWAIGLTYFAADLVWMGYKYHTTGQARSLSQSLFDYTIVENYLNKQGGILFEW